MLRGIHLLAAFGNRMLDWIDPKSMKLDGCKQTLMDLHNTIIIMAHKSQKTGKRRKTDTEFSFC